ncbi:C13 family peptidase [Undibacterium sp. YM2]|uniref:C13 family peptidase n=1 Tax=Undibacterium sp. YM2 TaxID=2058625 RepID=UPI00138969C6|nr:C13 family peptidase [Undibacterium sp. YM2]
MKKLSSSLWMAGLLVLLSACATKPAITYLNPGQDKAREMSDQLMAQQRLSNQEKAKTIDHHRVWYAGFGLHSGSKAFWGDVQLAKQRLEEINPELISYSFNNDPHQDKLDAPFAHLGSLDQTARDIASQAREGDVVTILLTSHGYTDLVAVEIGNKPTAPIWTRYLKTALAPLEKFPTVLIISSCYSGSLISQLKAPNRIIVTASAQDKVSYGCQPLANNTFFVDALFGSKLDSGQNLMQVFEHTKELVTEREKAAKFDPSSPQIFVGEKMQAYAQQPLKSWLQ